MVQQKLVVPNFPNTDALLRAELAKRPQGAVDILLVNPPVEDLTAYSLWSVPLGLMRVAAGLRGAGSAQAAEASHASFEKVKSVAELEQRLQQAGGKTVMLDFYADWCVSCKELERFTFSDAKVQARLKNVILLQADVTANSDDDKALLKKFGLFGPPGIIFFDKTGKENGRVIGYENPDKFLASMDGILK